MELPKPQFVVRGLLTFVGKKSGAAVTKQLYKREGYISDYEVGGEIYRMNKRVVELFHKKNEFTTTAKKITLKFVLDITVNGKKKSQTIVPPIDLLKEWD